MSVLDLDFDVLDIDFFSHFPDNIAPFSSSGPLAFAFVDTAHVGVANPNVAVTATPSIVATSTSGTTGFINLAGRVSRVYTKFQIPALPGAANDAINIQIGWDNFQTAGNAQQLIAQLQVTNALPITCNLISNIAGAINTFAIPAATFTNSFGALAVATWYELDLIVADKASVLTSIVASTSVPNTVLANTNQFGAYLRMRKEAIGGQFAGNWVFLAKTDMSYVPIASQVQGGIKTVKPGAGTNPISSYFDFLYIELAKS
jgi:hypothetical protein